MHAFGFREIVVETRYPHRAGNRTDPDQAENRREQVRR
jgi:hypothetical protein